MAPVVARSSIVDHAAGRFEQIKLYLTLYVGAPLHSASSPRTPPRAASEQIAEDAAKGVEDILDVREVRMNPRRVRRGAKAEQV